MLCLFENMALWQFVVKFPFDVYLFVGYYLRQYIYCVMDAVKYKKEAMVVVRLSQLMGLMSVCFGFLIWGVYDC
jgi:hypothetical protein